MQERFTLDELRKLPYVVHGSVDSIDRDVIYWISTHSYRDQKASFPNHRLCFQFCVEDKDKENRNLILIDEDRGIVVDCFKGTCDAINNQIKMTYAFHTQEYPCPVKNFVYRNVVLKMVRGVRQILSCVGRVCRIQKSKRRQQSFLSSFFNMESEKVLDLLDLLRIVCRTTVDDLTQLYHDKMKSDLVSLLFNRRVESVQFVDFVKICKQCIEWEKEFRLKRDTKHASMEEILEWFDKHGVKLDTLLKSYLKMKKRNELNDMPSEIQNIFSKMVSEHGELVSTCDETKDENGDYRTAGEEGDFLHIIKSITFQMVQTNAQLDNVEIYSKRMVVDQDGRTQPLMYRDLQFMDDNSEACFMLLNEYRDLICQRLLDNCEITPVTQHFNSFRVKKYEQNMTSFHQQSNGMLIDMKRERLACCPPTFVNHKIDQHSLIVKNINDLELLGYAEMTLFDSKSTLNRLFNFKNKDCPKVYSLYWNGKTTDVISSCDNPTATTSQQLVKLAEIDPILTAKDFTFSFLEIEQELVLISVCDILRFSYLSLIEIEELWKSLKLDTRNIKTISLIATCTQQRVHYSELVGMMEQNTQENALFWFNGQYFSTGIETN